MLIHLPMKSPWASGAGIGVERGADAAAAAVTHHHDVLDARGALTANSMAAEVPCWPPSGWKVGTRLATLREHEQLAGTGVEDGLGRRAAVAAGDDHGGGRLASIGQFPVTALFGGVAVGHERLVAVEQKCWKLVPYRSGLAVNWTQFQSARGKAARAKGVVHVDLSVPLERRTIPPSATRSPRP